MGNRVLVRAKRIVQVEQFEPELDLCTGADVTLGIGPMWDIRSRVGFWRFFLV